MLQNAFPALCVVLLLAGCSSLPSANSSATGDAAAENAVMAESASPADEARLVLESIALAQRVASASPDEQRQEVAVAARSLRVSAIRRHVCAMGCFSRYRRWPAPTHSAL